MARRKKRKYVPGTGGPPPSDARPDKPPEAPAGPPRPDEPPVGSTPPTEPTEPVDAGPPGPLGPGEPVESQLDLDEKTRKLNRLYWMRAALAVIAGASATFLFAPLEGETRRWASIGYMIILFAGTVFVAKTMRIPLPKADRKKIVTQALPSYIFLYLFVWVVSHTIAHAVSPESDAFSLP